VYGLFLGHGVAHYIQKSDLESSTPDNVDDSDKPISSKIKDSLKKAEVGLVPPGMA
jgi:hypothetical protein